ncbi:asparagine synthase (glutamine-hydrolyzing) [[Limnothrix rosea] IAM M-220]|uniref:asparagine synthase (glutamine-hydrolyzing) n=1 Tax=[Limnothrix rosea] IAM M-220 TaxID=454133 RepID=UPI00095BB823|nr:asparagine synthase (glutamine-hydrolyzing) [[Limnothrix rosea] IAM M-220]OKH18859.1 asparagine synthase (glutamine-hydrolyzing) [[Limnothrix rosea] IAM M-220]
MCGIAGILNLTGEQIPSLGRRLEMMNDLQRHRGPDGEGVWQHQDKFAGFGHRRLSIIDVSSGSQPMQDRGGNWLSYNGEIYNYLELREELGVKQFQTKSDTEVILSAYRKWGFDCVNHFRGMFAFSLWDEQNQILYCARDRFGIKPFYYTVVRDTLYFASEIKALLPFVDTEINLEGFKDYLTFQFCLAGKTLFKGIQELLPGHFLIVNNGSIEVKKYWEVHYNADFDHTAKYFEERVVELLEESIDLHLRSDVPVGSYLSGGLDSSIVASLASDKYKDEFVGFTGKFSLGKEYDESEYARALAGYKNFELQELEITANDFVENIRKVMYHLDYPVAGPGSFPQFMISKLASQHRKVVLGGQGADEIFGGYTRYLVAYFEQCIKGAIDDTMDSGKFIVTYESIIPNLKSLQKYKPMLKQFWKEGLFEDLEHRYFRLINRAPSLGDEIRWEALDEYHPFDTFQEIFLAENVGQECYFDSMTHFDFKTLLPALLQIEDRVSMAHGLESRVPFLDHPLIELAATIPANIKFGDGKMKRVLKDSMSYCLPDIITNRQDKMGFPVPLVKWMKEDIKEFIFDTFSSRKALNRDFIDNKKTLKNLEREWEFGRKTWGLLCLELWQKDFFDCNTKFR